MGKKNYPPGYEILTPVSDYAPWVIDTEFSAVYDRIKENTKVDVYRCHALWRLVEQALPRGGDVLEVGVWRGGTGALLAARTALSDAAAARSTRRTVVLADTFSGVVKAGPKDDYYKGGEHADTSVEIVTSLLAELELTNCRIVPGVFPEAADDSIASRRYCFCHIDVDVYQSGRDVLEWVWPRMPVGGIVVFDDYGFWGCEGVTALVNEEYGRPDRVIIHNLNGQAVFVKCPAPGKSPVLYENSSPVLS